MGRSGGGKLETTARDVSIMLAKVLEL